jgi:hypothetical protein
MENVLEAIRAAVAVDATAEARTAGVAACRAILAALEAQPGEPIVANVVAPSPSPIATVVAALRGVPADQLLDLAIAKLRAALPAGTDVPHAQPLKFQLISKDQLSTLARKTPRVTTPMNTTSNARTSWSEGSIATSSVSHIAGAYAVRVVTRATSRGRCSVRSSRPKKRSASTN